jgi:hypothetical protein
MAKVIYKPEEGTPPTHTHLGIEWGTEPVEVTDEKLLFKLRGNPFYEVAEDEAANGLVAKHKGRGVYAVVNGDDLLVEGLDKADAEQFNALSDADKAAYVEAHKA